MKWKLPLSITINDTPYQFDVDSEVENNRWVVTLKKLEGAIQIDEMKLFFDLDRHLISYEPVTIVTRKVVAYVTDDLRKLARYW